MSFPKRSVSNTWVVCPSLCRTACNTEKQGEAFGVKEEERGPPSCSPRQPQPPKLPLWGALQEGAGWAQGVVQENCLPPPRLLILTFLTISHLMPSERPYWRTLLIFPLQMPWWCVKGHTLKHRTLGKGKLRSVNKQEIWWSRRLLNTDSCLISIRKEMPVCQKAWEWAYTPHAFCSTGKSSSKPLLCLSKIATIFVREHRVVCALAMLRP